MDLDNAWVSWRSLSGWFAIKNGWYTSLEDSYELLSSPVVNLSIRNQGIIN
jgi:hypothetical protein